MPWLPDQIVNHLRSVADLPDLSETPYRCVSKLGRGGMGTIYQVEDTRLHRSVALKILNHTGDDHSLAERMLQEAYIIAALEHPGIVPIHDVGQLADGRVFYTMKMVRGDRLDEQVQRTSLPELLRIFQKVCEAVAFAHAHKVVHRDLKPENIMVGGFGEVLVMDWGLSKVLSEANESVAAESNNRESPTVSVPRVLPIPTTTQNLTEHGTVMGTPLYMAPEQERGEIENIDERADIFALGAILNFILHRNGVQSSETSSGNPVSRAFQRLRKTFGGPPRQLIAIVRQATAENKHDRYANALHIVTDIENHLNGLPVSAYRENFLESAWRWLRQNKFLVFLILVYILVRLIILFFRGL